MCVWKMMLKIKICPPVLDRATSILNMHGWWSHDPSNQIWLGAFDIFPKNISRTFDSSVRARSNYCRTLLGEGRGAQQASYLEITALQFTQRRRRKRWRRRWWRRRRRKRRSLFLKIDLIAVLLASPLKVQRLHSMTSPAPTYTLYRRSPLLPLWNQQSI